MAIENEQFEMIMMETMERADKTISVLNGEMKRGIATACPNPNAKTSPCDYCRFAAICRIAKLHHEEKEVEEDA